MTVGGLKRLLKKFTDDQEVLIYSARENDWIALDEDCIDEDIEENVLIGD